MEFVSPEHLLESVGRDRQVLTGADPRVNHVTGPYCMELVDQATNDVPKTHSIALPTNTTMDECHTTSRRRYVSSPNGVADTVLSRSLSDQAVVTTVTPEAGRKTS
jgi:hypothetical protein